jgi:hypothetical protein
MEKIKFIFDPAGLQPANGTAEVRNAFCVPTSPLTIHRRVKWQNDK